MKSVWELTEPEAVLALDARLQAYFSSTPAGAIGRGNGVFHRVGTPRRWLWPVLWLLSREDIVFPVWEREVKFQIVNQSRIDAQGRTSISAARTFQFRRGTGQMVDAITAELDGSLTDYLGRHGWLAVSLRAQAKQGAMVLTSDQIRLRMPWGWLTLPRGIAPEVRITEQFDGDTGRQRVRMRLSQPQLGLLYEYDGDFSYQLERG